MWRGTERCKIAKVKVQVILQNEIVKIEKENLPVIQKAEALTIKLSSDETAAYEILKRIKERTSSIEKMRKGISAPLNASLKATNALFKTLSEPLKTADGIIRDKILEFRQKREEAAAKKQAKLVAKAEAAEEAGDDEKAMELADKAADVEASVGESTVSKRWTYKVVALAKVPRIYLTLDNTRVRIAIRDGERNITGLRIYQEAGVRVL